MVKKARLSGASASTSTRLERSCARASAALAPRFSTARVALCSELAPEFCLHVRQCWDALEKEQAFQLHPQLGAIGSQWLIHELGDEAVSLQTCREAPDGRPRYLHVRSSWQKLAGEDDGEGRTRKHSVLQLHVADGSTNAGSRWVVERKGDGCIALRTSRSPDSPWYLHVRASWQKMQDGTNKWQTFQLHAHANHGSLWRIIEQPSPQPLPPGQQDLTVRHSLRGERNGKHNAGVGKKFDLDGMWQAWPGTSAVAMVIPAAAQEFQRGRQLVEESLAFQACLNKPTLPLDSLHMTIAAGDFGSPAAVAAVNQAFVAFADDVRQSGELFCACGVKVRPPSDRLNMMLMVMDGCKPREPWAKLLQNLRVACPNAAPPDFLHVNLGWYWLWNARPEHRQRVEESLLTAYAALEEALERMGRDVPLATPHLSKLPSMASFPDNCK